MAESSKAEELIAVAKTVVRADAGHDKYEAPITNSDVYSSVNSKVMEGRLE